MRVEKILSIITINYNGLKDTCELIESLPADDESLEVIVVDNASAQDEATQIAQSFPHVTVIKSDRNLGFAGGNNLGIKSAHGKYLLFLNNDTIIPHASDFKSLINRLESSEKIGMVCPKIRFTWGDKPIQYAGCTPLSPITLRNQSIGFGEEDRGQYDTACPTPYAHGAAMMLKREVIEKAGIMPECYFLYYEELDWSEMIRRAGYEIWYDPACTVFHKESQTTGQASPLKTYYITRNRLIFAQRNIQGGTKYLTYAYLVSVVATRDLVKYIFTGKFNLAGAVIKGITNFIIQ
ncbi:MAG: glycosyltransferase family 2 protein [Prevotella sp.]|nr:glycosyltransferase family 2 protein [Prevotella sp.]